MQNNHDKPHILVIDDEIALCLAVKDLLELYNYSVEYAITAEEGIEYLKKNDQTDAVLLDINLGSGLNGIEALPVIKEKFKYIQVIMFTSMTTIETGIECMKKGALDYVTKPYDATELLKKVATALERKKAEQMNDLYLGILVHDLKNPLQNIIGAIEVIKYSLKEVLTKQHEKFLLAADKSIHQIKTMINNILSVSRFENGTLSARRESFQLNEMVAESLEILKSEASLQEKQLEVHDTTPHNAVICTDKEFLSQVLVNIVSNAIRYTPQNGLISVRLEMIENNFIHAGITNSGSYIEEAEREAVFDKFASIQAGLKNKNIQNFGLGLTYSKMAVDAMGGKIWVDGKKEIPETTFHFTIKNHKDQ